MKRAHQGLGAVQHLFCILIYASQFLRINWQHSPILCLRESRGTQQPNCMLKTTSFMNYVTVIQPHVMTPE